MIPNETQMHLLLAILWSRAQQKQAATPNNRKKLPNIPFAMRSPRQRLSTRSIYARKIPPHPNRRSPSDERPERRSIHRPPQPSKPHLVVVPGQEPYPIQHRHILPVARSLADWRPPIIRGKLQRRACIPIRSHLLTYTLPRPRHLNSRHQSRRVQEPMNAGQSGTNRTTQAEIPSEFWRSFRVQVKTGKLPLSLVEISGGRSSESDSQYKQEPQQAEHEASLTRKNRRNRIHSYPSDSTADHNFGEAQPPAPQSRSAPSPSEKRRQWADVR